jgi:hypothetical protein
MAEHDSASIVTLHQPRPKTPAERARAYRERKRAAAAKTGRGRIFPTVSCNSELHALPAVDAAHLPAVIPAPASIPSTTSSPTPSTTSSSTPVTLLPRAEPTWAPARSGRPLHAAPGLLTVAALALAGVGVTMNGLYSHSLGATETAGHVFLALGLAADLVALALPSVAAGRWQARQRVTALAGWAVWLLTFVFAVTAAIGFASLNISDVTASRSSRVTPAIVTAQAVLADAMASRDRECRGGVGKFCREREAAANVSRENLTAALRSVEQTADPQATAAIRLTTWASFGALRPTENDFAMLRLLLLALLPQIGGVVLMIGRGLPARG